MIEENYKKEESRVWVGKNGVVNVELAKSIDEQGVDLLIKEIEEILKKIPKKADVLINMGCSAQIRSSQFRKETAKRIKEVFQSVGFRKVALFEKNIIWRTTASFLIAASGLNNIKVFTSKEEALAWLKQP